MEKLEKCTYFYNKKDKTESLGIAVPTHNWGQTENKVQEDVRKILPKSIEEFCLIEVKAQRPLGSFLSETLSLDFIEEINSLKKALNDGASPAPRDVFPFPNDSHIYFPSDGQIQWVKTPTVLAKLYALRRFVELCIEQPNLYSFGQFERLLGIFDKHTWHPLSLGFFTPLETTCPKQYLFGDGDFQQDHYVPDIHDLSVLENHIEHIFGGRHKETFFSETAIEVFECSGIVEAVLLSLFHLIQDRIAIRTCANCGKFFVPLARADAIYCDRPAPQDSTKTCKTYGSKVLWYENVMNDDVAKLARNLYCSKQMLAKRNPDRPEYKKMFEYFKDERKRWEKQVKAGTKTREEYAEWLRKMKLHKTLEEFEES